MMQPHKPSTALSTSTAYLPKNLCQAYSTADVIITQYGTVAPVTPAGSGFCLRVNKSDSD